MILKIDSPLLFFSSKILVDISMFGYMNVHTKTINNSLHAFENPLDSIELRFKKNSYKTTISHSLN